jgi:hypothetical protein
VWRRKSRYCVRARARARVCVRACVRACVRGGGLQKIQNRGSCVFETEGSSEP